MRALPLVPLALAVAGCTVGPDYAGPPATAADAAQRGRFVRATDPALIPAPGLSRWWETLGDPTLTALVDEALARNPSIDKAQAAIREAQDALREQRAGQYPSASANATYLHARLPGVALADGGQPADGGQSEAQGASSLDFYNLGINASWEADLFGGARRGIEQSRRAVEGRFADLADAQVSLSAQVATAYVNLRDVQERLRLNTQSSQLQQHQLGLTRQRAAAGTASALDVERLQTALENTNAQLRPLAAQRDDYLNQLAIMTGRTPGALDPTLGAVAAIPLPPAQVAIGDPAALIAHRPDVRAAERQLAASTAAIGVAKARELPGIKFMGILGLGGTSPGDVIDPDNLTALLAPMLSWSFLDWGKARAATRQAEAKRDQADAAYRDRLLKALADAETSLAQFGATRQQLAGLVRAAASATRAARLNALRVDGGTSSVNDQLDVERQRLSAAVSVAEAKGALTKSYITVQKELGLGWSAPATDADASTSVAGARAQPGQQQR